VSLAIWGCYYNGSGACTDVTNIGFVGLVSAGNGRYGQSDLAGNILEWNLDMNASYTGPCFDCANATAGTGRVVRGGVYNSNSATYLRNGLRSQTSPVGRYPLLGGRCARTP
jgi:formylglycine-generating enzyme required for sulfatase activity